MDTQEKKFFVPVLKTYENDLSKRWRIEWDVPAFNGLLSNRKVSYGNINSGKTVEARNKLAEELIKRLDFKTKQQVQEHLFYKIVKLNSGEWRLPTRRAYNTVLKSFIPFIGEKIDPQKVCIKNINDYILHLVDGDASKNKINKYRNALHRVFEQGIKFGLLKNNPVPKIKTKKPKRRSKHYFSDEQIQLFKGLEINRMVWVGILLLYYCYIRPKEQRLLKINAIDFEKNIIEIHGEDSKNDNTSRVIIPVQLMKHLEFLKVYPASYYVFGRSYRPGEQMVGANWLNYQHGKILKQLNIKGNYSVYSWKHTGVVKAVKAGINIKDLQLQLRHHSLDMVNEYLKDLGIYDSDDLLNSFPTL